MAASFVVTATASTSITLYITRHENVLMYYWIRVWTESGDELPTSYENGIGKTQILADTEHIISGLQPNSTYFIDIGVGSNIASDSDTDWAWMGMQETATEDELTGDIQNYGYLILYDPNGGTLQFSPDYQIVSEESDEVIEYLTTRIRSLPPTRDGFAFVGWQFIYEDGSTKTFQPGDEFTGYARSKGYYPQYILTAIWEQETDVTDGYIRIYLPERYVNGAWEPARWAHAIPWVYLHEDWQWHSARAWVYLHKDCDWHLTG